MKIRTNGKEITIESVVSTSMRQDNKTYPALRFVFAKGVTEAEINALCSGTLEIIDDEGNVIGIHEGYTTRNEHSLTVGKITTAEQQLNAVEEELNVAKAEHEEYVDQVAVILPTLDDETALSAVGLFPVWGVGMAYTIDERITYNDILYRVVQNHTSQSDWTPDNTPSLYTVVTVSESGYDVWVQPTGAHDAYNKNDIVEYNGTLYISLVDGNTYAPDAYPDGWKVYTE